MNHFKLLTAFAAALTLAACNSDELIGSAEGDLVTCTFNVQTPQAEAATRAYSDGLTATYLSFGVYRQSPSTGAYDLVELIVRKNQFVDHQTSVSLQLIKGYDYKIVFWGDAGPKCPYVIDMEAGTVTMDYATASEIEANNEERDVFYEVVEVNDPVASEATEVYLYRPLAQINFGADDLRSDVVRTNAPVADIEFTLTIPQGYLPTKLSLLDGAGTDAVDHDVTFRAKGVPALSEGDFPVEGYEYVSMDYVLPGLQDGTDEAVTRTVIDEAVRLTASHSGLGEDVEVTVYNMPLERNYRTNVYGSLLTNPASFEISIDPRYRDDFFVLDYKGVWYRAFCDPDMLVDALQKGYNVALLCDMTIDYAFATAATAQGIDLNGYTLTLGGTESVGGGAWGITYGMLVTDSLWILNGSMATTQGCIYLNSSASRLHLEDVTMTAVNLDAESPLFCVFSNASDCGLTMINCDMSAETTTAACAVYYGYYTGNVTIDNCKISATTDDTSAYGIANLYSGSGNISVTNTTFDITTTQGTTGDDENGTTVSYVSYGVELKSMTGSVVIDNCTFTVDAGDNSADALFISGISSASYDVSVTNCTVNVVSKNSLTTRGIYVENFTDGKIENCTVNVATDQGDLVGCSSSVSTKDLSIKASMNGTMTEKQTAMGFSMGGPGTNLTIDNVTVDLYVKEGAAIGFNSNTKAEVTNSTVSVVNDGESTDDLPCITYGIYGYNYETTFTDCCFDVKGNKGTAYGIYYYGGYGPQLYRTPMNVALEEGTLYGLFCKSSGKPVLYYDTMNCVLGSGTAYGYYSDNTSTSYVKLEDQTLNVTNNNGLAYGMYGYRSGSSTSAYMSVKSSAVNVKATEGEARGLIAMGYEQLLLDDATINVSNSGDYSAYGISGQYADGVTNSTIMVSNDGSGRYCVGATHGRISGISSSTYTSMTLTDCNITAKANTGTHAYGLTCTADYLVVDGGTVTATSAASEGVAAAVATGLLQDDTEDTWLGGDILLRGGVKTNYKNTAEGHGYDVFMSQTHEDEEVWVAYTSDCTFSGESLAISHPTSEQATLTFTTASIGNTGITRMKLTAAAYKDTDTNGTKTLTPVTLHREVMSSE